MANKLTIDIVRERAKELKPEYELLSTEYINSKTDLLWKCKEEHEFAMRWNDFQQNNGCPVCSGSNKHYKKHYKQIILNKFSDIKTVEGKYNNRDSILKIVCHNSHTTYSSWNHLSKRCGNIGCVDCSNSSFAISRRKSDQSYIDIIQKLLPTYIVIKILQVQGDKAQALMRCGKGHPEYTSTINNIISNNTKCPVCSKIESKVEATTRLIIEGIFGVPFSSTRPNFLKNPETGRNLELDGYNEELKLAFEYDGEQHYEPKFNMTQEDLIKRQELDRLKNRLCKENNITLIRIPYWENKNLEEFIKSELDAHCIIANKEG